MRQRLNGNAHWMVVLCVVVCLCMGAFGCDDTSSDAAKLEDARIAIDNGQYDRALDILSAMGGKEVLELQASAYAGKSGINTFDILGELDDDDESNTSGLEIVGKMLGTGEENVLLQNQIGDKKKYLNAAKDHLLDSVPDRNPESLDKDGKTQLAIFGLSDTALIIGDILCSAYGRDSVVLTKTWLEANIESIDDDYSEINPTSGPDGQLDKIGENIEHMGVAISAFEEDDNDLKDEFSEFKADIIDHEGENGKIYVTKSSLQNYLINL